MSIGSVSLIGAGPGHPDHLTMKGYRALQEADVIFYDALITEEMKEIFPKKSVTIYVGKRCNNHALPQRDIEALMIHWANKGKKVARLKGGDPFVFGRGGEELEALISANISTEVIPGLSSLNGVASNVALPLTHRKLVRKAMIVEGHTLGSKANDWQQIASFSGTVIIFMGSKKINTIAKNLIKFGGDPDTKLALVESSSDMTPYVQVKSLQEISQQGLSKMTSGPGIIYMGPTVSLFLKWQASQKIKNNIVLTPFVTPLAQAQA